MAWPTPQDYNEAVQSPQTNFSDAELKAGQVETDRLGLPRPISGRFAVVYNVRCGTRHFAVRCFQSEVPDQQERYAAISDHLKKARLPYTVGFDFLPKGIRVRGQWYPILKMEWITGEPLHTYIEHHLQYPATLIRLATNWVTMAEALQRATLAHGDLQDGNVLVARDGLKLIDYDGMYVPALAGRTSNEGGHRNYQHPSRTGMDYGPFLDNFSHWVIYVSIAALTIDPTFWKRFKGGDECLLFRKEDFVPKGGSQVLAALSRSSDPRLSALASMFESLLYLGPAQVPSLGPNAAVGLASLGSNAAPPSTSHGGTSWMDDHVRPMPQAVSVVHQNANTAGTPAPHLLSPGVAGPSTMASSRVRQKAINNRRKSLKANPTVAKTSLSVKVGGTFLLIIGLCALIGAYCFFPKSAQHHDTHQMAYRTSDSATNQPAPPVPVMSVMASSVIPKTIRDPGLLYANPPYTADLIRKIPWGACTVCLYGDKTEPGFPADVRIQSGKKALTWASATMGSRISVCNIMGGHKPLLMVPFFGSISPDGTEFPKGYCEIWTQQGGLHQIFSFDRTDRDIVCKDVDGIGEMLCYDDLSNWAGGRSGLAYVLTVYRWNGTHFKNVTRSQPALTLQHANAAKSRYVKSGRHAYSPPDYYEADAKDAITYLADYMAAGREKEAWNWLALHANPSLVRYLHSIRNDIAKLVPGPNANLDDPIANE